MHNELMRAKHICYSKKSKNAIFSEWPNLPALTGHPVSSIPISRIVALSDLQPTSERMHISYRLLTALATYPCLAHLKLKKCDSRAFTASGAYFTVK